MERRKCSQLTWQPLMQQCCNRTLGKTNKCVSLAQGTWIVQEAAVRTTVTITMSETMESGKRVCLKTDIRVEVRCCPLNSCSVTTNIAHVLYKFPHVYGQSSAGSCLSSHTNQCCRVTILKAVTVQFVTILVSDDGKSGAPFGGICILNGSEHEGRQMEHILKSDPNHG
jgi:hypothetical protein